MTALPGLVLGVGNLLLGDEGVGIHVVREVVDRAASSAQTLPPDTRVIDGGTLGLDLLPLLEESDRVVIVDAADLGREPGAIAVLRDDDLATSLASHVSVHQVGVADLLAAARLVGALPERVSLVAIQPARISPSLELSPAVAAVFGDAVEVATAEAWRQAQGVGAAGAPA